VRKPTAGRVSSLVERLLTDDDLARRAQDLGARLATDNGAARAADAIETVLAR
jgi:UDP:flavonoid glycosyltransferase YjiC (YdhE family)